jgi:[acyl-carrier-protein] S-malonyltransferase
VVVANLNAPGQVVVSGAGKAVAAAASLARDRGLRRAVPLNVSGAFHSPLMTDAARSFAAALDATDLSDPSVPVVCNVDAEPAYDAVTLRERLRWQLTEPVRWEDCVRRMVDLGAATLVEVGPGTILTGLARRIVPGVEAIAVGTLDSARELVPAGSSV